MDSPIVRCREEDEYQKKMAILLAEIRRSSDVQSVVAIDLLAFPDGLNRS